VSHSVRPGPIALAAGLLISAIVVFVAAALIALELSSGDRILPGVRILGLPVGGLTLEQAAAMLSPRSASILEQPIELHAGARQWATTPRMLGARLDPLELASAAYAVGHTGAPLARIRQQLRTLQADTEVPITSTADGAAIDLLLARIVRDVDRAPRAAVLDLAEDGTIIFQASEPGEALDQSIARSMLNQALESGTPDVELPTHPLAPPITSEQVADAHQQLVRMLGDTTPIQLSAADKTWTIERSELLSMLTLHAPTPTSVASVEVHDEPLQAIVQRAAHEVDQDPRDARFTLSTGQLNVLRSSQEGRAINQPGGIELLKSRIEAGERTVALYPPHASTSAPGDASQRGSPW